MVTGAGGAAGETGLNAVPGGAGRLLADPIAGFCAARQLSARQEAVLRFLVDGVAPKEIAGHMRIAESTVRFHAVQLYRRCDVRNQREMLALFARAISSSGGVGPTG
jgi:DNA-binding NarL/FixJ family response regulator